MTRARQAVLAITCSVALTGGVAACGAAKEFSAGEKINTAFNKLGESKSLSVTFALKATPAQLLALDKDSGDTGSDALTPTQAKSMSGLGATLTLSADKPLKEVLDSGTGKGGRLDPALNFALSVHSGDARNLLELRSVAGKEYLKVDLDEVTKFADDPSVTSNLNGFRNSVGQLSPEFAAVKALADGKWISIDPTELKGFGVPTGTGATPSALPSVSPTTESALVKALSGVLSHDVTLADKGTENGKDHIVVTAPGRKLVADLQSAVEPVVKDIPEVGSAFPTAAPTSVTEKPVSADVLINKDGSLSELALDVWQLNPKAKTGEHLPVALDFDTKAPVTSAPTGAVVFDPNSLGDLMSAFGGDTALDGAPLN